MILENYDIHQHNHRFAAWAAGIAAARRNGFNVRQARAFLEAARFGPALNAPDQLPAPEEIDEAHRRWRDAVIVEAKRQSCSLVHGVAAKLINVYLKGRFVCAGQSWHPRVAALHPPVDRLLLAELKRARFADESEAWQVNWSQLDSAGYERIIALIRRGLDDQPMWMIEAFWPGHQ